MRNENTIYCAARKWWISSQPCDNSHVFKLFQLIRWPHLSADFVMDVVKFDRSWIVGPPETHEALLIAFQKASAESLVFHACSGKRRRVKNFNILLLSMIPACPIHLKNRLIQHV